jgi:hypothetical protein
MLLAEESHTIQYLPRSSTCRFEAALQVGILFFEFVHSLRIHPRTTWCGIDCFHACFCLQGATPERRKLVSKMSNELIQLLERFYVRTFAV